MLKESVPSSTDESMLLILAHAIFPATIPLPKQLDWRAVYSALQSQAVEMLPSKLLRTVILPEDLSSTWRRQIVAGCMQFSRVAAAQNKLCELLQDANVSFVILKGMAAAQYYPTPEYRTMGDIDFLVSKENFDRAALLLADSGFAIGHDDGRHLTLSFCGISLEMHHYFALLPGEEEPLNQLIVAALSRSKWIRVEDAMFPCLPPMENGLVILQHIYQHFRNEGGLGLRQIIDWVLFAAHELDDFSWPTFRSLSDCVGLTQLAILVTRMGQLFLGLPETITWCRCVDDADCKTMMSIILESGNFGRLRPSDEQSVSAVSRQLRQYGFFPAMRQRGQEILASSGKPTTSSLISSCYGFMHYARRSLSISRVRDAVAGYRKGKRLDTLLKHLELK